jgi:hypothetical protein
VILQTSNTCTQASKQASKPIHVNIGASANLPPLCTERFSSRWLRCHNRFLIVLWPCVFNSFVAIVFNSFVAMFVFSKYFFSGKCFYFSFQHANNAYFGILNTTALLCVPKNLGTSGCTFVIRFNRSKYVTATLS